MTDTRVKFKTLWEAHPMVKEPNEHDPCLNEKGLPAFANECAIRMGVALKGAGVNVPATKANPHCWFKGHVQHVLQAESLALWLLQQTAKFGKVQKKVGKNWDADKGLTVADYKGKQGIIFFKDFWRREIAPGKLESLQNQTGDHIDVWDGTRQGSGLDEYFERSKQLWFWELP